MNTKTPRTDDNTWHAISGCGHMKGDASGLYVPTAFARQLEIELNDALEALKEISEYDETSIWDDDRDDAANAMLNVAREAITKHKTQSK